MRVFTIGGYGFDAESFISALQQADVDALIDIRQRAGMRGAKYSFLNKSRLQGALSRVGKQYHHISRLAPTTEIRTLQRHEDATTGVLKRERIQLSPSFIAAYRTEILANFEDELEQFADSLEGVESMAFFCVEEYPEACHRSIVADRVGEYYGVEVVELKPCDA